MKKLMNIAKKDSTALAALAMVVTPTIILFVIIVVYKYANRICKDDEVLLSQSANSSNGSYWTYELSTEDIIREKQYYESRFPLNFGPGYQQNWIFEIIDEGEVTIHWIAYSGDSINLKKSYNITYYFKNDGSYQIMTPES